MQENYIVGIYARLSRDDERAGESVSIENQKEMLSRYVREQGWMLYDYYCDDGVSGTTFDRPGLNRLVQDATDHKINLVLCKDLSRLGRDYIEAGKYTDFVFPSLGCRFIALNDGVDTLRKNNEMLVILKNVMNDLYARDTSSKIKAVKLSTFKSGKYVGCYAPLGYRKSEADKHVLEIDPVTAPVVQHIFDLRLQLNAEKVPAPRSFYYMAEGRENLRGETPFWNDVTVKTILRNEVYLGHMVQNKTGTVSYKNHKQVSKPESEWIRVENTHEPLISQDVWDAVQRMDNHPARGRSGKSGTVSLFGGLLRCMDCGSSMRYMRDYRKKVSDKEPEYKAYVCNRYASGGKNACPSHYINQKVLTQIVLTDIRCKAIWAQNSREKLREKILAQKESAGREKLRTLQAELSAIDRRLPELDRLVQSAYEDKVLGKIPENLCVQLLNGYEAERKAKQERRRELTEQLATSRENEQSVDAWLDMVQDYYDLQELDRPTLMRLIQKIEISEKYTVDDHEERDIHIYYNFVGYIEV
ncbi:MAG: recombinase family protein [Oscillibacter sp.]|nr:recombinase family protein [Oscillibacter sp.]